MPLHRPSLTLAALTIVGCVACSRSTSPSGSDAASVDAQAPYDAGPSDTNTDAGLSSRQVYAGVLDNEGNASVTVPDILLSDMPLLAGYVYSEAYAEPGYVLLGNIILGDGEFRFAAGAGNANAEYILVVGTHPRDSSAGSLDSSGDATVSVPTITLADMPITMGHVYSEAYAEPGYVMLGNIIPGDGEFRFAAGIGNANASYSLVTSKSPGRVLYTGFLDQGGNKTVVVPEIDLTNMPIVFGYVYSEAYAEPGYVMLGNIIPGDGEFRFAAGAGQADAAYILVILP